MQGRPTDFWGKLRHDTTNEVAEWHPLVAHAADVAAVTEALLRLPVWRGRLSVLARQEIDDVCEARLGGLAALHDIGKFNLGFQAKGRPELGSTAGHVREALAALFQQQGPFSSLHEIGDTWGDATTDLLVSALCHHGRPFNPDSPEIANLWQTAWWKPRAGLDSAAGVRDLLERCRAWFPLAFNTASGSLPSAPAFTHAFAGLVMLADWIGSDPRFFPFADDFADRMDFARRQASIAIEGLGLDVSLARRGDASGRTPFERIVPPDYRPRSAQSTILSLPRDREGSITVLEAETGSGKTEAALARFLSLFEAGLVDGLYFALPTRSAATQMHRRVHEAARRAFSDPPTVVLAVPGYLRVDDVEGRKLARFEVLWPDQDRLRHRAWAAEAPKRYLAGCVVVGTIDQVLLSSLMVGHAHLRATALLRHLLVVDEVHASDAYMTALLGAVLARHNGAGGHALLLSATLGGEARVRLLTPGASEPPPGFEQACSVPYPLISHRGDVHLATPVQSDAADRRVRLDIHPWLEDAHAVAREALAAAKQGAKVLVIRNTVTDCVRTQLALEAAATNPRALSVLFTCAGVPAPHHALFARVDRQALDTDLERRFGRERPDGGCVVVATQTVQQSLDLDADLLVSDLCPADVLLQRVGRLHRHHRMRPHGFELPTVFVIVPACRDLGTLIGKGGTPRNHHGLGSVYGDLRVLESTWRLIETLPTWLIPGMNRQIVEAAVHSSQLEAIANEGGAAWHAHAAHVIGAAYGDRRFAELNLVDWAKSYAELSFPSPGDQRIPTRLGEGDRRVRFAAPVGGPFGHAVDELVLRARWATNVPGEAEPENVVTTHGRTTFLFGGRDFVYDRHGLRPDIRGISESEEDDGP